jgi:RNA polymerase sigma factor (sigma-70 family)
VGRTEDLDLARRCAEGDRQAWEDFVLRTRTAVRRGAGVGLRRYRTADAGSLDNVQQQVYLDLMRDGGRMLKGFRGTSDLEGWVAVIAMRTAMHMMARRAPQPGLPALLPPAPGPSPGEISERREFLDRLDAALRRLSETERRLLQRVCFEERSYQDVARELGMPLNSVSPTLTRVKEKLRRWME